MSSDSVLHKLTLTTSLVIFQSTCTVRIQVGDFQHFWPTQKCRVTGKKKKRSSQVYSIFPPLLTTIPKRLPLLQNVWFKKVPSEKKGYIYIYMCVCFTTLISQYYLPFAVTEEKFLRFRSEVWYQFHFLCDIYSFDTVLICHLLKFSVAFKVSKNTLCKPNLPLTSIQNHRWVFNFYQVQALSIYNYRRVQKLMRASPNI